MNPLRPIGAALALLLPWLAATAAPARTSVPIRLVTLSDGMRRYSVTVRVGGTRVEAGLDTGSTGLRILPGTLAPGDAEPRGAAPEYHYGSGVRLEGDRAEAAVAIGEARGRSPVELVRAVGCTRERPACPGARLPLDAYRLQGDGLAGEGFRAILGTNMADQPIANPLAAIGARRWIVELPRPGEAEGRLILDPDPEEAEGYAWLEPVPAYAGASGGMHDSVAACLLRDGSAEKVCGALLMDSGDPGLHFIDTGLASAWPEGTAATLVLLGAGGRPAAAERFVTGRQAHASRMTVEKRADLPTPAIHAGLLPYFGFSVLYDAEHKRIGVKPRPAPQAGPTAELLAPR